VNENNLLGKNLPKRRKRTVAFAPAVRLQLLLGPPPRTDFSRGLVLAPVELWFFRPRIFRNPHQYRTKKIRNIETDTLSPHTSRSVGVFPPLSERLNTTTGPLASRLICYYRSRVSISLQRSQARAIHHRAARAVQSSTGARPLSVQDGFVRSADLYTVTRVGDSES
jgi:hypothetical protein